MRKFWIIGIAVVLIASLATSWNIIETFNHVIISKSLAVTGPSTLTGALTAKGNVTLGDTVDVITLPKGTKLIFTDATGADSVTLYDNGTNLLITSDNPAKFSNTVTLAEGGTVANPHADTVKITEAQVSVVGNLLASTIGSPFVYGTGTFTNLLLADTIAISGLDTNSEISVTPVGTAALTTALVITTKTDTLLCYRAAADTAAFTTYRYFGVK